jgi:hypothetical protein
MGGRASQARPKLRVRLSALHPPLIGGRNCCSRDGRRRQSPRGPAGGPESEANAKKTTNPGAATRRGNEEATLFDIVNRDDGQRFALRAPRCRTRAPLSCPGRATAKPERRSGTQEFHGKIGGQLKRPVVSPQVPALVEFILGPRAARTRGRAQGRSPHSAGTRERCRAINVMAAPESSAVTPGRPRTLAGSCPPAACGR